MEEIFQIQPIFETYEDLLSWFGFAKDNNLLFEIVDNLKVRSVLRGHEEDLKECKLVNSVHGIFFDINPASNNPDIREISRKQMKESCCFAQSIGAKNIVFHSSCITFLRDKYFQTWLCESVDFFNNLADCTPLNIFIENSQDVDSTPIKRLIEETNGKVSACLDIGHTNYSRMSVSEWIKDLGTFIGYLHYSDNDGLFDTHLNLGDGNVNWQEVKNALDSVAFSKAIPATLEVGSVENIIKALSFIRGL